jgi:chromosome segregation ATPase
MAQPNGKTNGVSHHEADKSQQQSKLRQLLVLAKEVAKDSEALLEYDTSAEGRKALEKELEAKKSEAQRLREFNDKITREYSEFRTQTKAKEENIFSEFEKRYKRYDSNNAAVETMQRQVAEARAELYLSQSTEKSMRDELDGLKTLLEAAHAQVQQHAAAVETIRSERDDHRNRVKSSVAELDACKAELAEAKSSLGDGILKDHGEAELREL